MQYSYGVKISHLYWKKNTTLPQKPQKNVFEKSI